MNHAPALVYMTHRVFVAWIIVVHFHLCNLLGTQSHYTILEVQRPMHVCLWQPMAMGTVRAIH